MCAPLLIAGAALTILGGAVGAQGQVAAGRYNQRVGEQNAKIADEQAKIEETLGVEQSDEARMRTRLALGQQRAALAANGLDLSSGTPADMQADTAMFGAIDERRIRANAARQAWGFRTQATNYRAQGALDRFQGRVGAASTILGSAGQALGYYGQYRATRPPGD